MKKPTQRSVHPHLVALKTNFVLVVVLLFAVSGQFCPAHSQPIQKPRVVKGASASEPFSAKRVQTNVRALARSIKWQLGDPIKEIPRQLTHPKLEGDRSPVRPITAKRDQLMETQARAMRVPVVPAISDPHLNLDGNTFSGVNPPDTVGDVGRKYYIQMINGSSGSTFTVYDKTSGSIVAGPTDLDSLGTDVCANGNGDPIVLYDHLANRWILSEFAPKGDNTLCVYVSMTDDPTTGGWYGYNFKAESFPDYPKYAVWPDAYYLASNESSPTVYAFDRSAMLAGKPATFQSFTAPSLSGFQFQSLQPGDLDGNITPPEGSPNYFIRHRDDEAHNHTDNDPDADFLEIFEFQANFEDPANATFTGPFTIPIADFDSELCGFVSFSCFEQPSGENALDPLREVVMWRVQYRNFDKYEALVGNMVTDVDANDRGGIRWFELRKSTADAWRLFQEGTYAPNDVHNRWMGSIAMDRLGNIGLGFSVGSKELSASLRYTGRLATDPSGTMPQPEKEFIEGKGSSTSVRWGDYSSLNVDPVDDCTYWYTGQYAAEGLWKTRIGSFSFKGCVPEIASAPGSRAAAARAPRNVEAPTDLLISITQAEEKNITDKAYPNMSSKWPFNVVFVCWENPIEANQRERSLVRESIEDTWGKHSALKFLGWQKCQQDTTGIRILIKDIGPYVEDLGRGLDGLRNGMVLNFTFNNWGQPCQSRRDSCIRSIAVHEFGHAIGFAHEQNRPDTPGECNEPSQGPDGNLLLTPWDSNSVMNYCNPIYNNDGKLSEFDIKAVAFIYGSP
jgi:hypothetical protein